MLTIKPDTAGISKAVDALRAGQLIAYPTETVYGLGVDPKNETALNLLYEAKGRDIQKKLILIIASYKQLSEYVEDVSEAGKKLIETFWPGPLSLLFSPRSGLSDQLLGPTHKICIRQTSHRVASAICDSFGGAIVSTSANISGMEPAKTAPEVNVPGIAVCIDGGELGHSVPSTIYDIENQTIVREGTITAGTIEKALSS
jgi:L-threonylcarbamoyladenylate synthase